MRSKYLTVALLGLSLAATGQHEARADAATEAALRSALQTATAQIAQLEDQVANLQASQAPNVATIEALRAQLQTLQAGKTGSGAGTENAADQAKADAAMAALKRQLAAQQYSLSKSQTAYLSASSAASSAAQQADAFKAQLAGLNSGLASCQQKNAQLYTIGNQILDAYSSKDDLFGSIADREPFTGLKRVQLQNIVQDDHDRLDANQIVPPAPAP